MGFLKETIRGVGALVSVKNGLSLTLVYCFFFISAKVMGNFGLLWLILFVLSHSLECSPKGRRVGLHMWFSFICAAIVYGSTLLFALALKQLNVSWAELLP